MPLDTPSDDPTRTIPETIVNECDLTLFVACYNEERNIVATLETVLAALAEHRHTWEILIIDDGSRDGSVAVLRDFIARHAHLPIRLYANSRNLGLAQNFIEAAFRGRGKYYRLICGDNVEPRETLVEVFRHLGEADVVLFHQNCAGRTLLRRILSRSYTGLVNLISGYHVRYYNGLPLFQRYHVMRWHTNYHGFGFQADMVTRLLDQGFTYTEVLVNATERQAGASSALTLRNFFSVAHTLLDLFIRRVGRSRFFTRRAKRARPQSASAPSADRDPTIAGSCDSAIARSEH